MALTTPGSDEVVLGAERVGAVGEDLLAVGAAAPVGVCLQRIGQGAADLGPRP